MCDVAMRSYYSVSFYAEEDSKAYGVENWTGKSTVSLGRLLLEKHLFTVYEKHDPTAYSTGVREFGARE